MPPTASLTENRHGLLAILERANRIASMTSLEDLLSQMLDLMIEISGGNAGTLYLLDRPAGELVFRVIRGEKSAPNLIGHRMSQDRGIVGAALQKGEPIVIDDLHKDPRWYREIDPEKTAHLRNAITFPLLLQGTPIGAVQIFNFSRAELELLQLLGNRMASEVDKALLLENARRSNQRLHTLVDIIGQIGATLDRDSLLNLLTNQVAHLLESDRSTIFVVDPLGSDAMLAVSGQQTPDGFSEKTDLLEGASTTTLPPPSIPDRFTAHSTIAVPLRTRPISVGKERNVHGERLIGSLMAFDKQHGDFDDEDSQLLEILAGQASTVLEIAALYADANELFLDFIKTLAIAIDAKDPYTRGHSQRVSELSVAMARMLGLSADALHDIRIGSLLHDIGKIGIPDHILTKPSRLTYKEIEQIQKHPGIGYAILSEVHSLNNTLSAIVEHHERLDGSGYPFGLHGERISIMGRIVAVADVYDALTTDRPYRKAMDQETVIAHLQQNTSNHFDEGCVLALRRHLTSGP